MTEWADRALGDVVTLINGDRGRNYPSAKHRTTQGIPFINAGLLVDGRIRPEGENFISQERFDLLRSGRVEPGDVVLCIRGSIGRLALASPDVVPSAIASSLVILRPGPEINPRFLYSLLHSPVGQGQIMASDNGAAQPNLGAREVARFRFRMPSRREQDSIADLLGSIDDLIENIRRRVDVLEEMARAIYREWFVRFRYPGHENAPLVDSPLGPIPDGWAAMTIGDVLELRYGKALKKDDRRGGPVAVVSSAGIVGWHDESLVSGPAIVVGRKGNVGSVTWVDGDSWPIDTAYFVETDLPLRYVAEQLRRTEFLNTHAAVPGLSRDQAYGRPFLRPPHEVLGRFESVVGALLEEGRALALTSERLVSIRDLLLPKLVTGQIDVSHLDLEALTEAASA